VHTRCIGLAVTEVVVAACTGGARSMSTEAEAVARSRGAGPLPTGSGTGRSTTRRQVTAQLQ
jgi:hypothetical protein